MGNESFFSAPQLERDPLGGVFQYHRAFSRARPYRFRFMTWPQVHVLLREGGIREVVQPVVTRYLAGEMSLDAAARRVAAILDAALNWKAQHPPQIRRLSIAEAVNLLAAPPHQMANAGGRRADQAISLRRALARLFSTPPVRHPNSDAVYDEAVCHNLIRDWLKAAHDRMMRLRPLYDEVARLLTLSREDAA